MAKESIVMFPFMAQGHFIPFLALANLINDRNSNLAIHFVSTPPNVEKLRSMLSPASPIRLHAIPFSPSDHGLPSGADDAGSIAPHLFNLFLFALPSLRPGFHRLLTELTELQGRPPRCVISDFFLGWTVEVARSLGVSHATFSSSGAYGSACLGSLWFHLPHKATSSPEFHVPGFPEDFRMLSSQLPGSLRRTSSSDPMAVFLHEQFSLSFCKTDAFLCNTAEELEVVGLEALRRFTGVQVWPVGPFNSGSLHKTETVVTGVEHYLQWLDSHRPSSAIYVSFGSKGSISPQQMMALATGLESSGVPFVWVVRPPFGSDISGDFMDEWLPEGFEARVTETKRGLLVKKWAPQFEILSHKSIGVFLSHCGWNSVLESLSLGVPIIGWPLEGDQTFDSKLLEEELGVGIEVATGVEEEVEGEKIAAAIKLVVAEEKGKEMKKKAMELSEKIEAVMRDGGAGNEDKGSSIKALDGYIKTLFDIRFDRT